MALTKRASQIPAAVKVDVRNFPLGRKEKGQEIHCFRYSFLLLTGTLVPLIKTILLEV